MSRCSLSPDIQNALKNGTLADPFSVLGWHPVEGGDGKTGSLIRVFNPAFEAVFIEVGIEQNEGQGVRTVASSNSSGEGCFEAFFPDEDEPFSYRVIASLHSGATATYEDPYAFAPVLGDFDLHLIGQGTHYTLWTKLGANSMERQGVPGVHFAVWAPNAVGVSVVGDFNGWSAHAHMMRRRDPSGVWEVFAPT